jgi:hypothetical protein
MRSLKSERNRIIQANPMGLLALSFFVHFLFLIALQRDVSWRSDATR